MLRPYVFVDGLHQNMVGVASRFNDEDTAMKQVTRDIDPRDAQDLLELVPRACLSFSSDLGPQAEPVGLLWRDDRYLVSIPDHARSLPVSGQEVVLLVDEGIYLLDLRAIYIRGQARLVEAPADTLAGPTWFEVVPLKTVAWDYGTLHEVSGGG